MRSATPDNTVSTPLPMQGGGVLTFYGSMIITSNTSFTNWGTLFGDPVLASALLDRLLHHATTINIRGNSYRMKDKLRAGVTHALKEEAGR
jgi:hypothetical protein